ncbi:MAG: hypothetical protein PHV23_01775 [Candidatus Gracilibacteria bacterium]|nr:hypothetical protein [Candidatus Gracilibacteria bacterium]
MILKTLTFFGLLIPLIEFILKHKSYSGFLLKPLFSINILNIFLIVIIIIISYNFLPKNYKIYSINRRANRFYKNWIKFKDILINYNSTKNENLQKEYSKLREIINIDFNFFMFDFIKIGKEKYPEYNLFFSGLNNLGECFSVREISKWQEEVRRTIPKELDCIDGMIIGLKEYFKRHN